MKQHLVLVGLPGSGKTVAGRVAAALLGAPFVDVDAEIARREAASVSAIFAEQGEPAFRVAERTTVRAALDRAPGIIAPGGGWAAQVGNLDEVRGRAMVVYLRTGPREAAGRLPRDGARPLLDAADPAKRLTELLAERERFYAAADHTLDTDGKSVSQVARELVLLARSHGGW